MLEEYEALFDPGNPPGLEILADLVAHNEQTPDLIRLFTVLVGESTRNDHPSHAFFVDRYAVVRERQVRHLAQILEREGLAPDLNLEQFASIIMAVMDGLQIQWLLDPDNVSMSETFELFLETLSAYLDTEKS